MAREYYRSPSVKPLGEHPEQAEPTFEAVAHASLDLLLDGFEDEMMVLMLEQLQLCARAATEECVKRLKHVHNNMMKQHFSSKWVVPNGSKTAEAAKSPTTGAAERSRSLGNMVLGPRRKTVEATVNSPGTGSEQSSPNNKSTNKSSDSAFARDYKSSGSFQRDLRIFRRESYGDYLRRDLNVQRHDFSLPKRLPLDVLNKQLLHQGARSQSRSPITGTSRSASVSVCNSSQRGRTSRDNASATHSRSLSVQSIHSSCSSKGRGSKRRSLPDGRHDRRASSFRGLNWAVELQKKTKNTPEYRRLTARTSAAGAQSATERPRGSYLSAFYGAGADSDADIEFDDANTNRSGSVRSLEIGVDVGTGSESEDWQPGSSSDQDSTKSGKMESIESSPDRAGPRSRTDASKSGTAGVGTQSDEKDTGDAIGQKECIKSGPAEVGPESNSTGTGEATDGVGPQSSERGNGEASTSINSDVGGASISPDQAQHLNVELDVNSSR